MSQGRTATRARRTYNRWVANETLEDFALRFTARRARKWSAARVANTSIGSISFLALEAIGATLTLSYGHANAVTAILVVGTILVLTGLPIAYHAARTGVDIDLLTRGAGFGYLGSTATSLIYASFTFIFFALEAAILAQALELLLGVPLEVGYLINVLVVIPLVSHGFTRIGLFQTWTQPLWVALHIAPFAGLLWLGVDLGPWFDHTGRQGDPTGAIDLVMVAAAAGVCFSLIAQIGEQVDFLRFLPEPRTRRARVGWWAALLVAGPGWAVLGTLKMLLGSFLAVWILDLGVPAQQAIEPTQMYLAAFETFTNGQLALILTGLFVVLSQLKINVTNAYAGSIAWSNFFSRLTYSHPGRVVWMVFNVLIALMLMEFGVFGALEHTLALYAHIAVAWVGTITADLTLSRPLGLTPRRIEFRRGHLFDINPVGLGAMGLATAGSLAAYFGVAGPDVAAFSSFVALGLALTAAPAIAWATRGHFYIARTPVPRAAGGEQACTICEYSFDPEDMLTCPFHGGSICSLCCSLESGCADACKPHAHLEAQVRSVAERLLPPGLAALAQSRYAVFTALAGTFALGIGLIFLLIAHQAELRTPESAPVVNHALTVAFGFLVVLGGVMAWLHALAQESRVLANRERERQTNRLLAEIRAHKRTDTELQQAKDAAETANQAKSRYLIGISHELRTPLNSVLGYAQLMEADPSIPRHRQQSVRVIRHSSEHLADLIEGLLDISKIEAGQLEIVRRETALRELLDQLVAIFRMEAAEKRLAFAVQIAEPVPERVHADERRLRQILMNLLSNAVRYTDVGQVTFSVRYRTEVATFEIHDTGRGIPPEAHERIFEPFERIQDPDAPVHGTGLGLTITRLLVKIQGGDLRLESAPGEGSTFRVQLLLPRGDPTAAPKRPERIYGYRGARRRILVVDDNAGHRALLEDALRPLGFEIAMAESGEAALSAAAAAPPDLLLIDVAMPGMSGWTLAAGLRRDAGLDAPIIMVSAHAEDDRLSGEAVAHHDDFLAKPVDIDLLLDRIEQHLKLTWLRETSGSTELTARPSFLGTLRSEDQPRDWSAVPDSTLARLEEMIAIGHVRGADGVLQTLDAGAPETAAFIARARSHLEELDLDGLNDLVAEARRDR
jgi:signal transduction histidine kinase/CheY-like chemotaxis protein